MPAGSKLPGYLFPAFPWTYIIIAVAVRHYIDHPPAFTVVASAVLAGDELLIPAGKMLCTCTEDAIALAATRTWPNKHSTQYTSDCHTKTNYIIAQLIVAEIIGNGK